MLDASDGYPLDGDDDWPEVDDEGRPYKPPGNDHDGEKACFADNISRGFVVPERLRDKPYELIEAANDWHYAMMNDLPRNEFYREALRRVVTPESVVLEIGAGSGLLSIIAASLGAKCVVAIEANRHLAAVAREIIRRNGYEGKVHILNKMSTDVAPDELAKFGTPTVLLSEILGTLLLGESALHYVMDARQRLVAPAAAVVPRRGCQFAALVESNDIASITSVRRPASDSAHTHALGVQASVHTTRPSTAQPVAACASVYTTRPSTAQPVVAHWLRVDTARPRRRCAHGRASTWAGSTRCRTPPRWSSPSSTASDSPRASMARLALLPLLLPLPPPPLWHSYS